MQSVVQLPLELPFELRVIQIARMHFIKVGMHGHGAMHELDADLDAIALGLRAETQQGVLIEAQLLEHAVKPGVGSVGHGKDCNGYPNNCMSSNFLPGYL